jgi:hypothetical protein
MIRKRSIINRICLPQSILHHTMVDRLWKTRAPTDQNVMANSYILRRNVTECSKFLYFEIKQKLKSYKF